MGAILLLVIWHAYLANACSRKIIPTFFFARLTGIFEGGFCVICMFIFFTWTLTTQLWKYIQRENSTEFTSTYGMPCVKTLFKITDFCRFFFFNIKSIKIWNAERSFGKYVFNTRKKNIYFNEMMTFKLKHIFCFKINLKKVPWYEGKTH